MLALTTNNLCNFEVYQVIGVSLILETAYIVSIDQNKCQFYINNHIDKYQFNQLYDPDCIETAIKNAETIARKLRLAWTKATNNKLKVAKKKQKKRDEKKAKNQSYYFKTAQS